MTPFDVGIAFGLMWGIFLLVWSLIEASFSDVSIYFLLLTRIYRGIDFTPQGFLIAFLWGLFDGFITGYILAWFFL